MQLIIMNKQQDISYFVSFCIEQYKNSKHLTGDEAMRQLDSYGVLDYLADNYETLHTHCLIFTDPTEEWLDFVMKNRTDRHFTHNYDVVYGPVANDRVYAAFALYEGGLMTKQNLIAELKTYKLVDQYLFHTPKSLQAIKFHDAKQIKL